MLYIRRAERAAPVASGLERQLVEMSSGVHSLLSPGQGTKDPRWDTDLVPSFGRSLSWDGPRTEGELANLSAAN